MILQERCRDLGVELEFHREVPSLEAFGGEAYDRFDLIVAADGVNSATRREHADWFRPSEDVHRTKFVWYGTDLVFDAFTFIFRDTPHGMFQVHAYPFDAGTSTFIVETLNLHVGARRARRRDRAGVDGVLRGAVRRGAGGSPADVEPLAVDVVRDAAVRELASRQRRAGGRRAHTAHFTIGSGTKLAMEDAIALSQALDLHGDDLERALTDYELERQPAVERLQEAALESATYFENVGRYASFEPLQFAFNLLTRSGRITHLELEKRDPAFTRRVDAAFEGPGADLVPRPPLLAPVEIGGLRPPGEPRGRRGSAVRRRRRRRAIRADEGLLARARRRPAPG